MWGNTTGNGPWRYPPRDAVVDGIERRRCDADPNFPGAGGGLFDVLVAQDVRIAELVKSNCLHVQNSPSLPSDLLQT
jgi:hypothetical protein